MRCKCIYVVNGPVSQVDESLEVGRLLYHLISAD
jgi:hypothetical protein